MGTSTSREWKTKTKYFHHSKVKAISGQKTTWLQNCFHRKYLSWKTGSAKTKEVKLQKGNFLKLRTIL